MTVTKCTCSQAPKQRCPPACFSLALPQQRPPAHASLPFRRDAVLRQYLTGRRGRGQLFNSTWMNFTVARAHGTAAVTAAVGQPVPWHAHRFPGFPHRSPPSAHTANLKHAHLRVSCWLHMHHDAQHDAAPQTSMCSAASLHAQDHERARCAPTVVVVARRAPASPGAQSWQSLRGPLTRYGDG